MGLLCLCSYHMRLRVDGRNSPGVRVCYPSAYVMVSGDNQILGINSFRVVLVKFYSMTMLSGYLGMPFQEGIKEVWE